MTPSVPAPAIEIINCQLFKQVDFAISENALGTNRQKNCWKNRAAPCSDKIHWSILWKRKSRQKVNKRWLCPQHSIFNYWNGYNLQVISDDTCTYLMNETLVLRRICWTTWQSERSKSGKEPNKKKGKIKLTIILMWCYESCDTCKWCNNLVANQQWRSAFC